MKARRENGKSRQSGVELFLLQIVVAASEKELGRFSADKIKRDKIASLTTSDHEKQSLELRLRCCLTLLD